MTLGQLLLYVGIAAIFVSLIVAFIFKKKNDWLTTYLQSFCGCLFLFSGWVKAVDPMGTAYKLENYFTEFESTFEGSWFSFIAPLFPLLSEYGIWLSVGTVVFEILLGIMLILGLFPKFTSWAFTLLILFFTGLTGFTYLTGYVPDGINFFEFSKWGEYNKTNMKVTDCGCFGDFLILEPKVSFLKDIFLLIPSFYFIFFHKKFHQLIENKAISRSIVGLSTLGLIVYCLSNYMWDLPQADFRPFNKGKDVKKQREAELDAMASIKILAWKLKNKESGKVVELSNDIYMKEFKNYPKAEWEVVDQIKSEPAIKASKISEMEFTNMDGNDVTDEILDSQESIFVIIAKKLEGKAVSSKVTVQDSIFAVDTIHLDNGNSELVKSFMGLEDKQVTKTNYKWDSKYIDNYKTKVVPLIQEAAKNKIKSYIVVGGADPTMINAFEEEVESGAQFLTADDILLKTIVRSNPGITLWKGGKILNKWHISQFPGYEKLDI